jgi:hypothetical protein
MITKYKGYTLVLDFSKQGMFVPTYVKELDHQFPDVAQAKRYIDSL